MAADSHQEPVWFVQLTAAGEEPKQEGPITLNDLLGRIKKKQLIGDDYVWTPGMENWGQIQEIEVLKNALPEPTMVSDTSLPKKVAGKLPVFAEFSMDSTRFAKKEESKKSEEGSLPGVELETSSDIIRSPLASSVRSTPVESLPLPAHGLKGPGGPAPAPTLSRPSVAGGKANDLRTPGPLIKAAGLSVLIGISFYIIFGQFSPTTLISEDVWAKMFVRFPTIADVADDDYLQLKEAATKLLFVSGPRLALAPSRAAGDSLSLYLATNFPAGSSFEIYLQGDRDTLAGDSSAIPPIKFNTRGVLTRIPPITAPEGYYWVHVFSGATQPKRTQQLLPALPAATPLIASKGFPTAQRLLIAKKLFLGGVPDLNYQAKLKDYFSNRRGKALAELDAIRDVLLLVEDRLSSENKAARGLMNLPNQPARAQAWSIYESSWNTDATNLEKFTKTNFHFYGQTQGMARTVVQTLMQLHTVHSWLTKASPEQEIKHGGSSRLNTSSVEVASILVNGENTTNTIKTKVQELKTRLDHLTRDAENPNTQIEEEISPSIETDSQ